MRYLFICALFLSVSFSLSAQISTGGIRPRIGLTLSGGGAKGLAHIGILKAIDSAGLKVDYITGTSMGSIIGSLYAVGYSANQIEDIARGIDWDLMLSNQSSLRNIIMDEKQEYGKYIVELPWVNNWFRLPIGVLEGQELWLKLAELLYPAYQIKDFKKLPIPFKCIATDVSSGQGIAIDSGEIVSAIRASMAIPSFFTAVQYGNKKLVDGGVVRNFPVKDVKEMGADIVVGSNVAAGLLATDKVNNAIQVLLQVAFFREAEDTRLEVPLCNIYIPISLDKFSMASFSQADEILDSGIREGRKLYPALKKLADSLNRIYGPAKPARDSLQKNNAVKISSYQVNGLKNTTKEFFIQSMNLLTGQYYTSQDLSRMVRRVFGTRLYERVNYSLQSQADGTNKIVFDVSESALTYAKLGLHYNEFSGISAILNLTSRDFVTPNSRSLVTLNIGENFRIAAEHLQYFSRQSNFSFTAGTQFDEFAITSYKNYKEVGIYNQSYLKFDGKLGYSTGRNLALGIGTRFEFERYHPSFVPELAIKGKSYFTTSYLFVNQNTLDRPLYPKHGFKINSEIGWVYRQHPSIDILTEDQIIDSPSITSAPYGKVDFLFENYASISKKSVLLIKMQAGINFNYSNNIMNEYVVGGLTPLFHNEINFAGLREGNFYAPSVTTFQVGYRFECYTNTYLTARVNTLFSNFISKSAYYSTPDFLSGYSLTFSYNFALGPLELSAMYCDQSKRLIAYINIGIPF